MLEKWMMDYLNNRKVELLTTISKFIYVKNAILWDLNIVGEENHKMGRYARQDEFDEELPEFIEVTDVLDLHGFFPTGTRISGWIY